MVIKSTNIELNKQDQIFGEGLYINNDLESLSWVDISRKKIFYACLKKANYKEYDYPFTPSNIFYFDIYDAIVLDDKGIAKLNWHNKHITRLFEFPRDLIGEDFRGNDGVMLPNKDFLFGVMHKFNPKKYVGSVWYLTKNKFQKIQENFIPNSFIPLGDYVLISDSHKKIVYKYSINMNKIVGIWKTFNDNQGEPDGGFSKDNYCFFAMWGNSRILKFDKNANYISELYLDVTKPSNCKIFNKNIFITYALNANEKNPYDNKDGFGNLIRASFF